VEHFLVVLIILIEENSLCSTSYNHVFLKKKLFSRHWNLHYCVRWPNFLPYMSFGNGK
jgi:hypothetical protein